MTNATKVLIAAAVGGLLYAGSRIAKSVKEFTDNVKLSITGIGKPSVSKGTLNLPIQAQIFNASDFQFSIDKVNVDVYAILNGRMVNVGMARQISGISIKSGYNTLAIETSINLDAILKAFSLSNITDQLEALFLSGSLPTVPLIFKATITKFVFDIDSEYRYNLNLNNFL